MTEGETNSGYVYLMRNRSMPTRVKIGFTMGDPMERANELSTPTGVPEPFEVVGSVSTPWPSDVESEVFRELADLRVSPNREFFTADIQRFLDAGSGDDLNQYFMLVIAQAAERVDLQKRLEALRKEEWEMKARHASQIAKLTSEWMKRNSPERYEEMLQWLRQAADNKGGSAPES